MGVEYLITSASHQLKLDDHDFVRQLQKRWPNVLVHYISDPSATSVLQWQFVFNDGSSILGDFSEQGISYKASGLTNIASFALWYRTLVPHEHKLFLYKSSLSHNPIELTAETTLEDIINGFDTPLDLRKYS